MMIYSRQQINHHVKIIKEVIKKYGRTKARWMMRKPKGLHHQKAAWQIIFDRKTNLLISEMRIRDDSEYYYQKYIVDGDLSLGVAFAWCYGG